MKIRLNHLLLAIVSSSLFTPLYAVSPGFYMGLMAGPATNNGTNQTAQVQGSTARTVAKPRSNQFGTRIYMGYKVNPYGAIEGGFSYFSAINYNTNDVPTCGDPHVRLSGFDILGKGSVPLGSFEPFVKGGGTAVYQTTSGALNSPKQNGACGQSKNTVKVVPTVSVGVGYDLNQNWVGDISWTRLATGGILKSVDFVAIGFSYHFVNKYCGQFLCDD